MIYFDSTYFHEGTTLYSLSITCHQTCIDVCHSTMLESYV